MAACVVLTAVADRKTADRLARGLVKAKFAACVTVVPGVVSHYRWQRRGGSREAPTKSREVLLLIKTARKSWARLSRYVRKHHPYELPELVAWPIAFGEKGYLAWLKDSLK